MDSGLVNLLLTLLFGGLIIWLIWWGLNYAGVPDPPLRIIMVVVVVIFIIWVLRQALPYLRV